MRKIKKYMRLKILILLELVAGNIIQNTACVGRWGEVPLPDSLRRYYEEKAKQEDGE